jgi:hypothetical protein
MLWAALVVVAMPQDVFIPSRTAVITPVRNATFNKGGIAKRRVQGGNPRTVNGHLVFDGGQDGDRQVDPQIAVGGGYVLHGTNSGITIYDKQGNFVDGVPQSEFLDGIDPKMFFDPHNRIFAFDLWVYWDKAKIKPVNISVSETADPRGAWNTYPVPAPNGVDGGAIGYSRKWIAYVYPGGKENTFVLRTADAKAGKPAKVFFFDHNFGNPVFNQDRSDELRFVQLTDKEIVLTTLRDDGKGAPIVDSVIRKPHGFAHFGWPPPSPQRGSDKTVASGDRNPKNIIQQGKSIWFSQAVNIDGRAGVQWHQFDLQGRKIQSGTLKHAKNSFIQTTLAVNKRNDVLVGFQATGPDQWVSARFATRLAADPLGQLRPITRFGEGLAATAGGPWGDYSGSTIDGDNLTDLWTVQSVADKEGKGDALIARFRPTADVRR